MAGRLKGEDPKSAGRLRGDDPKSAGRLGRETGGRAVSRPPKRGNEDRLAPKSAGRVVAGRAAGKDEKALTEGNGSAVERGRELKEGAAAKEGRKGVDKGRDGAKLVHAVGKDENDRGAAKVDGSREAVGRETEENKKKERKKIKNFNAKCLHATAQKQKYFSQRGKNGGGKDGRERGRDKTAQTKKHKVDDDSD